MSASHPVERTLNSTDRRQVGFRGTGHRRSHYRAHSFDFALVTKRGGVQVVRHPLHLPGSGGFRIITDQLSLELRQLCAQFPLGARALSRRQHQ